MGQPSDTKDKILFDTSAEVKELGKQVAVLVSQQKELFEKIDDYMHRSVEQYDRMDVRVTSQGMNLATLNANVETSRGDIKDLKNKSNLFDIINLVVTAIVGTVMYFVFGRPTP